VDVYRTDTFERVATIPVGALPHGIWPSGDGTRIFVANENGDTVSAIDTLTNQVVATIPIGQAAQALVYVPEAVPVDSHGSANLQPLTLAGQATQLTLGPAGGETASTVALFDQGITQVLQVSATGLAPKQTFLLALASDANGGGALEPLARFTTNPSGAAIVDAVGPIRQVVHGETGNSRRWLVIAEVDTQGAPGRVVQVQH
jgi:YVTN family beta-propeller protein